jgi:hypothetical protein
MPLEAVNVDTKFRCSAKKDTITPIEAISGRSKVQHDEMFFFF